MSHPRPFYYLENFCAALAWLQQRYGDLLNPTEHAFIERFHALPRKSAALLVRMVGRRGDLFRTAMPEPSSTNSRRHRPTLHAPEFRIRRASQFARCFAQLESHGYRDTIRHDFAGKHL